MAKSEKLKKLDVGETKGVSGGMIYELPGWVIGQEHSTLYVPSRDGTGFKSFTRGEDAEEYAKKQGLSIRYEVLESKAELQKKAKIFSKKF